MVNAPWKEGKASVGRKFQSLESLFIEDVWFDLKCIISLLVVGLVAFVGLQFF